MKHQLNGRLAQKQVKVALVGAGGTGSRMLENLMNLHRAMVALGHPGGLHVTLIDDDVVSPSNVGRQAFYPCDVGSYKAFTLINRANMAAQVSWTAIVDRVSDDSEGFSNFDLVIGAVDNRTARRAILSAIENSRRDHTYYLDMGNRSSDGQILLGEVQGRRRMEPDPTRLPHVGEMFPALIDSGQDHMEDDTPSCSLAEALQKQALFINPAMALAASSILWNLFTKGEIEHHGAFVNLDCLTTMPIPVDRDFWARFGVHRVGEKRPRLRAAKSK